MLTAVFAAIALLIALCVQSTGTPLAGTWLLFFLAACCVSYRVETKRDVLWWAILAWLLALGISTFILAPVPMGGATMWVLAAAPIMALSINKNDLPRVLDALLAVLVLYAFGLITQVVMNVHYTITNYIIPSMGFQAASWPLLDPNNAAAVINAGLIPSLYMAVRKPKWLVLVVVFGVALFLTVSKAGMIAAAIACIIIGYDAFGAYLMFPLSFIGLLFAGRFIPEITQSLNHRLEIWEVSLPLLKLFPFTGTGLGSFSFYYHQIKTPEAINVNYAHNDLLQFAVEMGLPAAFIFYLLGVAVFVKTTRDNMVSGCVLLALFIQSMLEFQFYVVSVSILSGAALAYHRLTCNSADRTMA